jgi:hypothetical protein
LALYTASFIAFHSVFNYLDDEEEEAEERQTVQPESERVEQDTPRKLHNADGDLASESDTEDDVQLPDEAPEDSWFIPLGLIYLRHPTLYKASDPEWQSFVAFSRDKKRNLAIRSSLIPIEAAKHADLLR